MTWHLKDRALERKLNDLVGDNKFTEALNHACCAIGYKKTIVVKFGPNTGYIKGSFRCYFEEDELTNIGYDPQNWNSFPDVTPPEGVYMRVEFEDKSGGKAVFYKNEWLDTDGTLFSFNPVKFRPWDD